MPTLPEVYTHFCGQENSKTSLFGTIRKFESTTKNAKLTIAKLAEILENNNEIRHRTEEVRTCHHCSNMKDEIAAAVVFMVGIVKRNKSLNQEQLSKIGDNLAIALFEKYRNHWYEDTPSKGQGFRCIRISGDTHEPREAMLLKVARKCGIKYSDLKLPMDLTVWVDPCEVACRFGEKGTTMIIATFPRKSTSFPESVNMETRSSSTGSSPVTSDSESDSESSSSHRHSPTFQPLNFVSNESRFYHAYRRNGRHQQYRSANHVSYAARDKYRWVNNPVVVLA